MKYQVFFSIDKIEIVNMERARKHKCRVYMYADDSDEWNDKVTGLA